MAAPLTGVTPMYALCFFGYGIGQKIFCNDSSFKNLDLVAIGLAGATSGIFTTPILAPLERCKCVLQVQGHTEGGKKFKGPMEVYRHLLKEGGLASVNRGFFATMLRDSLGSFFYFGSYEYIKYQLTPEGKSGPNVLGTLFAGGMAGIFNWIAALPVDTLKSKLQVAPEGKYPNGIRSVFADVVRTEGFQSLFRGLGPVMIRAFPANAACFLGYESTIKFLNHLGL
jgi:solute carrier family 25 carnitine/acylcarnitine transporter 20/29